MIKVLHPKNNKEWLKIRSGVLTATEIGIILGLNPWSSVKNMMKEKTINTEINNSYIFMGNVLEPVVVKVVNKALGASFKLFEQDNIKQFFIVEELNLGATPDAYDDVNLLECKTTKPGNYLKWSAWPPAYYLSQLYAQLMCTEKQEGYLAILSTDLTQYSPELKLPVHIHKLTRGKEIDAIFSAEVLRYWEMKEQNKAYRVNRKQSLDLELKLRLKTGKIYG